MVSSDTVTECRVVRNFERVVLQVDNTVNEVVVKQGERESLIVTGRPDTLSRLKTEVRDGKLSITLGGGWSEKLQRALHTSLTRQWVRCDLTVRNLTSLEFGGLVRARAYDIRSDRLSVSVCGSGRVYLESLAADQLDVAMRGTCQVEVTGQVREQRVVIEGMGSYDASKLESRAAVVDLKGVGRATVWAVEDLNVTSCGIGSVEYHGSPRVKKHASPLANVIPAAAPA